MLLIVDIRPAVVVPLLSPVLSSSSSSSGSSGCVVEGARVEVVADTDVVVVCSWLTTVVAATVVSSRTLGVENVVGDKVVSIPNII